MTIRVLPACLLWALLITPGVRALAAPIGDAVCAFSDRYPVEIAVLGQAEAERVVETGIDVDGVDFLNGPGLPGTVRAYVNEDEQAGLEADGWRVTAVRNLAREQWLQVRRHWEDTGALGRTSFTPEKDLRFDNWYTHAQLGADLQAVADAHPDLVQVISIGNSIQGRAIWFVKISDNVSVEENEPEFKFSSSIHGDEVVGMELCRRMIHYLVDNYGADPSVTNLVNGAELWFCPLHNPDGYANGTRYNAQGLDLNRRFPDPVSDPNDSPTGRPIEVQHMMNFQYPRNFILGANYHGGALVMNIPWDCRTTACPDHEVFWPIAEGYSSTNLPMWNGAFYHGWTIGGQWYVIHGGFQDWAYQWRHELHITIEVASTKWPAWSQMDTYWNNNRQSMLWYMNRTLTTGVKGTVTDVNTGLPLAATVTVSQIGNPIVSDAEVGDYHRLLNPGTYTVVFTKTGYPTVTLQNVAVVGGEMTVRDVQMGSPSGVPSADLAAGLTLERPSPNPFFPERGEMRLGFRLPAAGPYRAAVYDVSGREVRLLNAGSASLPAGAHALVWDGRDDSGREVPAGLYWIGLRAGSEEVVRRLAVVW